MESSQGNFGSYEWIHSEIRRRASAMAEADSAADAEDPYIVASRQVFEELLARFAEARQAA